MATFYSGFWSDAYSILVNRNPNEHEVARQMHRMPVLRELMRELNGVAAGQAALVTHPRPDHPSSGGLVGGLRTIETVNDVNRVTAAADQTAINAEILAHDSTSNAYPTNGDSNPRGINPA